MTKKTKNNYPKGFTGIFLSLLTGLSLTFKHFIGALIKKRRNSSGPENERYFKQEDGIFTLKYPDEELPTPDNGRYKLHNHIDDCTLCDKCAKICPVNCIDIESIRATEPIGKTSNGINKRLYAASFDIDMAKCMYCGLCTTVCPTQCLTMTTEYDFSTNTVREMNFGFSEMTEAEIAEKKQIFAEKQAEKKRRLRAKKTSTHTAVSEKTVARKANETHETQSILTATASAALQPFPKIRPSAPKHKTP